MKGFYYTVWVLVLSLQNGFCQSTNSDLWTGYFSYNSVIDIQNDDNQIIVASENAIFIYTPATNSYQTITTIEDLSGDYISTIHYSSVYDILLIGYQSGLIEVYNRTEKEVLKVVDILNKATIPPENKRVNHFLEYNDQVFISTNYGLSLYNLETLEFGDTYFIGTNGNQVQVRETKILDNVIYAGTNSGLKTADLNNTNLIDFQFWNTLSFGDFSEVDIVSNTLYVVQSGNDLYELAGTVLTPSLSFTTPLLDLRTNNNNIIVTTGNTVYHYTPNLSLVETFSLDSTFDTSFTTALFVNESIYLGTQNYGLLKPSLSVPNGYEEIHPSGPLRNISFALNHSYDNLWVTFGDYTASYNPSPNRTFGFSNFNGSIWTNVTYDSIQQAVEKPIYNLNAIAVNPTNSNQVFISSFQHGILNYQNNTSIELFDDTNSALESLVAPGSPNYKSIRVSDLKFDRQGLLWSLTSKINNALKQYNPSTNQWQSYSFASLIEDPINDELGFGDLVIADNGTKWIGSYRNGVIGYNEKSNQITKIQGEDEANLPIDHISALALDRNNVLWIGTHKGLRLLYNTANIFTNENPRTEPIIILEEGLPKELLELQYITEIIVDGSNNKWISTVDAGVFYLSADGQNTIYHFTKENSPLPSNNVTAMTQNINNGIVYFGTSRGLVSFSAGGSTQSTTLEDAFIYPNPVRPGFNIAVDKIKIKNLSDNVNIKITDVEGNLVAEAQSNTNLRFKGYNLEIDGGTAYWNGKNLANNLVASGVYVVLISDLDELETKVLKIMLIRS